MAQLTTIGWVSSELKRGISIRKNPYILFSVAEHIGFGESARTQFYQVWVRGDLVRQIEKAGVKKGSLLMVSGSLELEEYTKKDGVTQDKRLKLMLTDWNYVPGRGRIPSQAKGIPTEPTAHTAPDGIIDGERDNLPE